MPSGSLEDNEQITNNQEVGGSKHIIRGARRKQIGLYLGHHTDTHTRHSLKVPAHDQPGAVEIEREGERVQREYGRNGVDEVLAPEG